MKQMHPDLPIFNVYDVSSVISGLMREDWIYTNEIASHISLHRVKNYRNFFEIFRHHFKNLYAFSKNRTIVTSAKLKALNILKVIEMLKSKDVNEFEKSLWMWDG